MIPAKNNVLLVNTPRYPNRLTILGIHGFTAIVVRAEGRSIIPALEAEKPKPTCISKGNKKGKPLIPKRVIKLPMSPILRVLILNKLRLIMAWEFLLKCL